MFEMSSTAVILSAVITAVASIAVAYITRDRMKIKHTAENIEKELAFQRAALSFDEFVSEWNDVYDEIVDIIQTTNVDRFLLLRAWNGKYDPKWTTAFFQVREVHQKPVSYVHFELDADYIERLNQVIRGGSISFAVRDIPDSYIKDVYTSEGVTHSAWFFIDKSQLKGSTSAAVTYCSFSTHSGVEIDHQTFIRCRIVASRMKGIAHTLNQHVNDED